MDIRSSKRNVTYNLLAAAGKLNSCTEILQPANNTCILVIGNGTTNLTADDYTFRANDYSRSFEVLSQTTLSSSEYNGELALITRIIKNTSSEDMIINRMGIYLCAKYGTDYIDKLLIAQEALDEPVTVKPGEKHIFAMSLCID